jgi:microcystin-dependent protein
LTIAELPTHTHILSGTSNSTDPGGTNIPTPNLLAAGPSEMYGAAESLQAMAASSVGNAGGPQAHPNMQPFLTLNFSIALQGVFPSST